MKDFSSNWSLLFWISCLVWESLFLSLKIYLNSIKCHSHTSYLKVQFNVAWKCGNNQTHLWKWTNYKETGQVFFRIFFLPAQWHQTTLKRILVQIQTFKQNKKKKGKRQTGKDFLGLCVFFTKTTLKSLTLFKKGYWMLHPLYICLLLKISFLPFLLNGWSWSQDCHTSQSERICQK